VINIVQIRPRLFSQTHLDHSSWTPIDSLSHPSLDLSESSLSSESFEAGLLARFVGDATDSLESLSHPSTESTEKINFTLLLNLVAAVQNVVLLQFRQPAPMSLAKAAAAAAVFCRSRGRKALTLDFLQSPRRRSISPSSSIWSPPSKMSFCCNFVSRLPCRWQRRRRLRLCFAVPEDERL
jgi:hypothetical protein